MGVKGMIKRVGEIPAVIGYETELQAMRGQYAEWLFWQEHARMVKEDAELDEGLTVAPESYFGNHPIHAIQTFFAFHPETCVLYGDEDCKGKDGGMEQPWFRPDWSPELLESCFYFGSLIAFRRSFLEEKLPGWRETLGAFEVRTDDEQDLQGIRLEERPAVVFINETPGEEYRETVRSLCERAGGWERGSKGISHLPGILYHCSSAERLQAFQDSATGSRREESVPEGVLSVIILSKDHPELLAGCVGAVRKAASGSKLKGISLEIIVVDNGSSKENREKMEAIPDVRYFYEPMEFHFSKLCNLGARASTGEFLLFLNDDVELLEESRLEEMLTLAARPGVGSVGLKLYYPDSFMIQHAGITNLPTGPVHKLLFLDDREVYYFGRNRGNHNVLAVSAACVMLRREVFFEAGGFEESLPVAYNDVALGFRLRELGYRNVCTCDAHAFHHESLTRGSDADEKKRQRLFQEQERLYELFPEYRNKDPYFSDFLSKCATDTRIRPTYETMKNACQTIVPKPVTVLSGIRMDPCLSVQIEEDRNGEMLGYAVVLGDDNACYDRWILFEKESGERFRAKLHGQYRPDLAEKMPEQTRIVLCGFWIYLEKGILPAGKYRVGCLAKRKVGNLKLFYWSDHVLSVKES